MTFRGRDPATESVSVVFISSSISLTSLTPKVGIQGAMEYNSAIT